MFIRNEMNYIYRFVEKQVRVALGVRPVVAITGPRRSGKSTLVKRISADDGKWQLRSLDEPDSRDFARSDPIGFLKSLGNHGIIDEIQRVPDLFLTMKLMVDEANQPGLNSPGMFIITGSINLRFMQEAGELLGNMKYLNLFPFSYAELTDAEPDFLERAFGGEPPAWENALSEAELVEIILAGGFPTAISFSEQDRRADWYRDYLQVIIESDIESKSVAEIRKGSQIPRLVRLLTTYSGQTLAENKIDSDDLQLDKRTISSYIAALERLMVVELLQPWHKGEAPRLRKASKLHFVDTGMLASQRNFTAEKVMSERELLGPLLETFVFTELQKHISWQRDSIKMCYFGHDNDEVDFVLEKNSSEIVGIEVKATHTLSHKHFDGLRKLKELSGSQMCSGFVLYLGDRISTFSVDDNFFAVPVSCLFGRPGEEPRLPLDSNLAS